MKAIIYALINREAHPPENLQHPLLNKTPHQLVPFLEFLNPSEYDSVCNSPDTSTRIFATHCPLVSLPKSITDDTSSSSCKVVYLCREIKDNVVSLFHFANKNKWQCGTFLWRIPSNCIAEGLVELDRFGNRSWNIGKRA